MSDNPNHLRDFLEENKAEFSDMFDAAVDRWLDKQFAKFGKWAIGAIAAAVFVWLLKLCVSSGVFK